MSDLVPASSAHPAILDDRASRRTGPSPEVADRWQRGHESGPNLASSGGAVKLARRQLELGLDSGQWSPDSIATAHALLDALDETHRALEILTFTTAKLKPGDTL